MLCHYLIGFWVVHMVDNVIGNPERCYMYIPQLFGLKTQKAHTPDLEGLETKPLNESKYKD